MSTTAAVHVVRAGDSSGNGMIVKTTLSSGREIFGFATKNHYGGEWDLGPTWNYLVSSDRPFLVDTGRRGTGRALLEMLECAGFRIGDLAFVTLSHGHEDHDGGLFELAKASGAEVLAHRAYERLIRVYPGLAPSAEKDEFPATCWDCRMPKSFYGEHCLTYHQQRNTLMVSDLIDRSGDLGDGVLVLHTPGHSPDAVAFAIDGEAVLVGDTVLPDITPHPTREAVFAHTRNLLPPEYREAQQLYGLRAYLRSLRALAGLGAAPGGCAVLPAHRLFYKDRWNHLDLEDRTEELFAHHLERCSDIWEIVRSEPKTAEAVAREHFAENLLKSSGLAMAVNEILSHCELLEASGDVVWEGDAVVATGRVPSFEALIGRLRQAD